MVHRQDPRLGVGRESPVPGGLAWRGGPRGWERGGTAAGGREAQEADGLDAGGRAADQAGELEVEEGGVQDGGRKGGGGGQAAMGQELAVDQRRQDGPGGRVEARPACDAALARGGASGHGGAELLEDVGEAADQGGTVADELVAAGGAGVPWGSREDEHVANAAAAGGPGRGEAARVLGRLDHDHGGGQRGDQAVAGEEVGRAWLGSWRVLARQGATAGQHPGEQAGVGAGIGNVQATAEHDHGASTGIDGPGVGGRVDADRATADHAPAGPGQPGPDGAGGGAP